MVYLLLFLSYLAGSKSVSVWPTVSRYRMTIPALEAIRVAIIKEHPAVTSSRTILNRSFRYSAPILWSQLNFAVLNTMGQISMANLNFCQNSRLTSFTSPILSPPNLHLPLQIHQDPSLGKSMATRLTSLHRLSNFFTNNDLDSIGYFFRLPF